MNIATSAIFPPRPEKTVLPALIPFYETRGWWAQIKKNGTCTVIRVRDEADFKTRHGVNHKAWTPTNEHMEFFSKFRGTTFVGELLHSKGPSVKNTLYLFDLLDFEGESLVGTKLRDRMSLLDGFRKVVPITGRVWITDTYKSGLRHLYNSLYDPLDEGIVMKDPEGVLTACHRKGNNQGWQVKCRIATKNYGF